MAVVGATTIVQRTGGLSAAHHVAFWHTRGAGAARTTGRPRRRPASRHRWAPPAVRRPLRAFGGRSWLGGVRPRGVPGPRGNDARRTHGRGRRDRRPASGGRPPRG